MKLRASKSPSMFFMVKCVGNIHRSVVIPIEVNTFSLCVQLRNGFQDFVHICTYCNAVMLINLDCICFLPKCFFSDFYGTGLAHSSYV
jgi:hypothetical protein